MNNEKTLREKSMEWWDEVTESEAAVYRMQYFKTRESLTDEQVDFVYQSEHPATIKDKFQSFDGTNDHFAERETISQQTNSVVSIEDAANSHAKLVWGVYVDDVDKDANDTRGGLSKKDFKAGANWQKEQYSLLLENYGALLNQLIITGKSLATYGEHPIIEKGNSVVIEKANSILSQLNK